MKNIILKTALLALTIAGAINAADAVVTALPRVAGFAQVERFSCLPYPLNFIEAHKTLTQTSQREAFLQALSNDRAYASVSETLSLCQGTAQEEFPYNVLSFIEAKMQLARSRRAWPMSHAPLEEFNDILNAYPELMTTPYGRNLIRPSGHRFPSQVTLATRVLQRLEFGFLAQMLQAGFDPRIDCSAPDSPEDEKKPFLKLNPKYTLLMIIAISVLKNSIQTTQPCYHQLGTIIESTIDNIGPDVARLIAEFTPTDARTALQAYRERGKSLLDMEIKKTGEWRGQRIRTYWMLYKLIELGVPAPAYPDQAEPYIRAVKSQKAMERIVKIGLTSACIVGAAGIVALIYWLA